MYYAQINQDGLCVAVTQASGELSGGQFVPLQLLDVSLLDMKWTGSAWEEVPQEPPQ